jgi:hypothetical protein
VVLQKKITFFLDISKIFRNLFKAINKIRKTAETSRPIGTVQKEPKAIPLRSGKWQINVVAGQKDITLSFSRLVFPFVGTARPAQRRTIHD